MGHPQKRFLCILPNRLGDIIFCTPAIALLRELKPDACIDVVSGSTMAEQVLARNPAVNNIYICPKPRMMKRFTHDYDAVFCLNYGKTIAKMVQYIKAPCYIREQATPQRQHAAQLPISAVAKALLGHTQIADRGYCLYPSDEDYQRVTNLLQQQDVDIAKRPTLIGFQICCSRATRYGHGLLRPSKKAQLYRVWEVQRFYALAQALYALDNSIHIVLTGSDTQDAALKPIRALPYVIDFIGKTTVLETTVLISQLSLFVTIDTGPLHIAAATAVPIVALLGGTLPEVTGPFPMRDNITVIQAESMDAISVEEVLQAVISMLQQTTQTD